MGRSVRAGFVTAKTTHADLVRLFGSQNVKEGDVGAGDEFGPGTSVRAEQLDSAFMVEWVDPKTEILVYSLHLCHAATKACRWHTGQGITKGTSLKTLERINGRTLGSEP
jgi:hypothetical protein